VILNIITHDFVAAVILNGNGTVWEAAPILKYMRGWNRERVLSYCSVKRWRCEET
jgi:hypothetical protein